MLLFLLFLLPIALITYYVFTKDKKILLPLAASALIAMIVCACRFFFSYEHRLVYDSFSDNFIYFSIKQSLLPLLLVTILFAVFSRDKIEYKVKAFFPTLGAFFAIYLPYCVIAGTEYYYEAYQLFLKPVIYLAMLGQISLCLINALESITSKKIIFVILDILIILVYAIYPAVSDALYAIDYSFALILIIGILYSLLPLAFFLIKIARK